MIKIAIRQALSLSCQCGRLALLLAMCSVLGQSHMAQALEPQPSGTQTADDHRNLPLRGLTGTTSLGVYPQLDKGLLVSPGVHPVTVSVPLSEIVSAHAQITGKIEQPALARGRYQGVLISVVNNADRPIIFDGDAAVATSPTGPLAAVPMDKLAELSVLPEQSKSFGRRFVTDVKATTSAAVTVGWAQTLRDQKRMSGPVVAPNGGRYGLDEQRREDQLRRFGKRVLWPGDQTTGVLYFDGATALAGASIDLPVSSYYDHADHSTVNIRN